MPAKPPAPDGTAAGPATFVLAVAVLAAAVLFGGAARRDLLSDYAPQLLSLALLLAAGPGAIMCLRHHRLLFALIGGVVLLPLLQIAPLPSALLASLPGRAELFAPLLAVGEPLASAPLSLRPGETIRSALAWLPALAMLAAALVLSAHQRRWLALLVVAGALLSAPLGMLQVIGGPQSPLYFYAITNPGRAVGFFANANHYAALFYVSIPLCVALSASERTWGGVAYSHIGLGAVVVLILGLALSGSRTALILGPIAVVLSYAWFGRGLATLAFGARYRWAAALGLGALLLPAAVGMGLMTTLGRFETQDLSDDLRWTMASATYGLVRDFLPFGAGLGAFERLYQWREPAEAVMAVVVNHAHNDWLEALLETGLYGSVLMALGLAWLVRAARSDRSRWEGTDARLARAGVLAIGLLVAHSLWDYPLRTVALSSVLALAIGLAVAPLQAGAKAASSRRRRRSSARHTAAPQPAGAEAD